LKHQRPEHGPASGEDLGVAFGTHRALEGSLSGDLVSLTKVPSRTSATSSNSTSTISYKERVAPRLRDDHALERRHLDPIAEQRREYFRVRLFAQRIEAQLGIVRFAIPLM
jgi:hypothetical protein